MSYTAKDSFWAHGRIVHRGDVLSEHDPVVEGREHLFDHEKPAAPRPPRGRHKHEDSEGEHE